MFSTTEIETHSAHQFLERSRDKTSRIYFGVFFVQIFRPCMSIFSEGSNTMSSSFFGLLSEQPNLKKKSLQVFLGDLNLPIFH